MLLHKSTNGHHLISTLVNGVVITILIFEASLFGDVQNDLVKHRTNTYIIECSDTIGPVPFHNIRKQY